MTKGLRPTRVRALELKAIMARNRSAGVGLIGSAWRAYKKRSKNAINYYDNFFSKLMLLQNLKQNKKGIHQIVGSCCKTFFVREDVSMLQSKLSYRSSITAVLTSAFNILMYCLFANDSAR